MPMGTLMKKIHCQPSPSTSAPPASGPPGWPRPAVAPHTLIATPRRCGGENLGNRRQGLRREYPGADPLHHPGGDQHGDAAREPTPHRGDGEHHQADQVQVLRRRTGHRVGRRPATPRRIPAGTRWSPRPQRRSRYPESAMMVGLATATMVESIMIMKKPIIIAHSAFQGFPESCARPATRARLPRATTALPYSKIPTSFQLRLDKMGPAPSQSRSWRNYPLPHNRGGGHTAHAVQTAGQVVPRRLAICRTGADTKNR